jgi:Mn-dependent DtxR family transcriptional regulator
MGTGLTGEKHRSDHCATTQSGDFKAEDTHRDHKVASRLCKAVVGHPSDGVMTKTSEFNLEGHVSLII